MTVVFSAFPTTLDAFRSAEQNDLTKPENTCAMFLAALALFDRDKAAGTEAINLLRGPRTLLPYDVQFLKDRLRGKAYLPFAYFDGAAPENQYKPAEPYTLQVLEDPRPQDIEDGYLRIFLKTAGADSPRPIKLRRKGNCYYLWEYSSVLSGIRIPAAEDPWA